jgi:vitamin B12 transporter
MGRKIIIRKPGDLPVSLSNKLSGKKVWVWVNSMLFSHFIDFIKLKMNKKILWFIALAIMPFFLWSQEEKNIEEVVITDSKTPLKKEQSGKIIEVISAKDLENKKGQTLGQIINQVAGIELNGVQATAGKDVAVYVRGGSSSQVLFLIDGNPVTDASGISLFYDLRLIPVEQVESVEIMKGASSTLYGTGASSAVINIKMKKANKGKAVSGNAYTSLGTNNTADTDKTSGQEITQGFRVSGNSGKFSHNTALNNYIIKGLSEARGENFENDRSNVTNISQKFGYSTDKFQVEAFANYDRLKNTFDGGALADDLLNNGLSEQFRTGITSKYKYNNGEVNLVTGFANLERVSNNSFGGTLYNYYYKSRTANVDLYNRYNFSKSFFAILGIQSQFMDTKQEDPFSVIADEKAKASILDPYFTAVYNSSFGFNLNAGARYNTHSEYGNQLVGNINPSFNIKNIDLKILGSVSTAYIVPSLYQLYSAFGNLDLKPQEDVTAEFGFEKMFYNKKVTFSVVGFFREEENRFDFFFDPITFAGNYINAEELFQYKGIETSIRVNPIENISIQANYTFTENLESQQRLIPKHKANVNLDWKLSKRINWNAQYQYVDPRADAFKEVTLKNYQLVNTNFAFDVLPNKFNVFVGATNILNTDFEEVYGYNTRGRNFKIGMNIQF